MLFFYRGGVELAHLAEGRPEVVVGRHAPPADLCVPERSLSQRHALFRFVNGTVLVEDLGSTNGTWIRDRRVQEPTAIAPGGEVMLGNVPAHVVAVGPLGMPPVLREEEFHRELDWEIARAQQLGRSVAVLAVQLGRADNARDKAGRWALRLREGSPEIKHIALGPADTLLMLLPDTSGDKARQTAHQLALGESNQREARRVGVALHPDGGSSSHKLVEAARKAAGAASAQRPVVLAPTGRGWKGDVSAPDAPIIGGNQQDLFHKAQRAASRHEPVLLYGETGTGKEVVASYIHREGSRRDRPFVPINCGAIPETLVESEFFGHEAGSFTGAISRPGCFREADGGTLFLDEIGELKPDAQAKLLRAIDTRKIRPIGGSKAIDVDVRIIAATHRDLRAMITDGRFREDLYYRLNTIELTVKPLRERRDEIEELAMRFLAEAREGASRPRGIAPDAMVLLRAHRWPGNVRALRGAIASAVAMSEGDLLTPEDFPSWLHASESRADVAGSALDAPLQTDTSGPTKGGSLEDRANEFYTRAITDALRATGGDIAKTAEHLGMARRTLTRWMKELGIKRPKR
ncbi:sigma 54-interacting transcriptional regulator [Sorangium cellulosum]|uniref:sigma 54-interacting transcriptional regulator n=1 Tax=Sorangium cellulosum TaxID=56 RepID=UPI0013EA9D11|nr:sigma 54-interacting transcriptional regulator [Sorangium cellulosum]